MRKGDARRDYIETLIEQKGLLVEIKEDPVANEEVLDRFFYKDYFTDRKEWLQNEIYGDFSVEALKERLPEGLKELDFDNYKGKGEDEIGDIRNHLINNYNQPKIDEDQKYRAIFRIEIFMEINSSDKELSEDAKMSITRRDQEFQNELNLIAEDPNSYRNQQIEKAQNGESEYVLFFKESKDLKVVKDFLEGQGLSFKRDSGLHYNEIDLDTEQNIELFTDLFPNIARKPDSIEPNYDEALDVGDRYLNQKSGREM